MSGILTATGLGKSYRKWGSEWRRIVSWFSSRVSPRAEHWVLRDIGFTINPGQAIAIIGQNGAGKSTLLKLITGTIQPTEGQVNIRGRVAAILELGMGFNPELTGRENALHSAGLMGYNRAEIEKAMPEIEAFAEIGDYFDQPVRMYSSGMQMRVAFSVATAFRPDLLIVDEALSVGDNYFQHKSFERIRRFKEDGVSIMIVTHSMGDVRTLCDRVILIDQGRILKDGPADEVVDYYNALVAAKENAKLNVEQRREKNGWLLTKSGSGEAKIKSLGLYDANSGEELAIVQVGQIVEMRLDATVHADIDQLVLGYIIRDKQGHIVWGTNTWHVNQVEKNLRAGGTIHFKTSFKCTLGPGSYSISPALTSTATHLVNNYEWQDNMIVFDVLNTNHDFFIGTNWISAEFSAVRCDEGSPV